MLEESKSKYNLDINPERNDFSEKEVTESNINDTDLNETTIEEVESLLDEVISISDEIEDSAYSTIDTNEGDKEVLEQESILDKLKTRTNLFLKQISEKLASYSQSKIDQIRDQFIYNKVEKLNKFYRKNNQNIKSLIKNIDKNENEIKIIKVKAEKEFQQNYLRVKELYETIRLGNWGKSNKSREILESIDYILKSMIYDGLAVNKIDEVFETLKIYEDSQAFYTKSQYYSGFNSVLENMAWKLKEEEKTTDDQEILSLCRNDPYLTIKYCQLDSNYNSSTRTYLPRRQDLVNRQVDIILKNYPEKTACNDSISENVLSSLLLEPEKYVTDPEIKSTIFELFLSKLKLNYNNDELRNSLYFFEKNIADLSEEQINEIIDTYSVSNNIFNSHNIYSILSLSNLSENNLKKIHDKVRNGSYSEEPKVEYSKGDLLKKLHDDKKNILLLFQSNLFDLSVNEKLNKLSEVIDEIKSDREKVLPVFIKILSNFQKILGDLPKEKVDSFYDELLKYSVTSRINELRMIWSMLPEFDIPPEYKEKIISKFSAVYNKDNWHSRDVYKKVFNSSDTNNIELTDDEKWLVENKDFSEELELKFYENGEINDLRHFFYDVIEEKRSSVNRDLLIKKYLERIGELRVDEFMDLLVVRKKISMDYVNLFISHFDSYDSPELFSRLEDSARLGQISESEYKKIILDFNKFGDTTVSDGAFDLLINNSEKWNIDRKEISHTFIDNLSSQFIINNNFVYEKLKRIINSKCKVGNLSEEETNEFIKYFFEKFIQDEKLQKNVVWLASEESYFEEVYKDEESRAVYIEGLLSSKSADVILTLLDEYFKHQSKKELYGYKNTFIDSIDADKYNKLFQRGLDFNDIEINSKFLSNKKFLSQKNKEDIIKKILSKKEFIEELDRAEQYKIDTFCEVLASFIEDDRTNNETRIISEEDIEKIFDNIFKSQFLAENLLSLLIQYHRDFLLENKNVLAGYIEATINKNYYNNSLNSLISFASQDKPILSNDQVIKLSTNVLKSKAISDEMYEMYLNSRPDYIQFYINQDLLNNNISSILDKSISINYPDKIIYFLKLQRENQGKSVIGEEIAHLDQDQERKMINLIIENGLNVTLIKGLQDFDEEMFISELNKKFEDNTFPLDSINVLITSNQKILENYFPQIIDFYLKNSRYYINKTSSFDSICNRYGNDKIKIAKLKDKINKLEQIEHRSIFKAKLVEFDLLTTDELREFYDEIRAVDNVHSQVILSAEILGSLVTVSANQKIFEKESKETKDNIQHISNFVQKYSKENKGRTIAVMLFSREYLPERNLNEMVSRVSEKLKKYEKVLNKFQYKNIPEGLKVSIGLEYEITNSTATGYKNYKNRDLKSDIVRLSKAAHIGNGADAVHEIATKPTDNPYLMLLEIQLLNDIEFVDFNFERSPEYQKGARGYHMTIGGEYGLSVNSNTNFLQNVILSASWGGINAGETGKRVSGGRGVTLRSRYPNDGHNVSFFDKATNSVELRSLSIDKMEQFQRAVTTAFNGGIAIQAIEKYTKCTSDELAKYFVDGSVSSNEDQFIAKLKSEDKIKGDQDIDEKSKKIIYLWAELVYKVSQILNYHNEEFIDGERYGYIDENGILVETNEFGGEYNASRFDSVLASIDSSLSLEEYVGSTKIDFNKYFYSFDVNFSDCLTKTNNLFLKPGVVKYENGKKLSSGDQANALSAFDITKLNNKQIETRTDASYLKETVLETAGERREGYYNIQGGSEKMITHACQIALLEFNKKIEELVL